MLIYSPVAHIYYWSRTHVTTGGRGELTSEYSVTWVRVRVSVRVGVGVRVRDPVRVRVPVRVPVRVRPLVRKRATHYRSSPTSVSDRAAVVRLVSSLTHLIMILDGEGVLNKPSMLS